MKTLEEIKKEFEKKFHQTMFCNKHEVYPCEKCGGVWNFIESTISQTRQEVIEEIDKLQKQCSEADGMVDGMTALHTLREKLLEDLNKK